MSPCTIGYLLNLLSDSVTCQSPAILVGKNNERLNAGVIAVYSGRQFLLLTIKFNLSVCRRRNPSGFTHAASVWCLTFSLISPRFLIWFRKTPVFNFPCQNWNKVLYFSSEKTFGSQPHFCSSASKKWWSKICCSDSHLSQLSGGVMFLQLLLLVVTHCLIWRGYVEYRMAHMKSANLHRACRGVFKLRYIVWISECSCKNPFNTLHKVLFLLLH